MLGAPRCAAVHLLLIVVKPIVENLVQTPVTAEGGCTHAMHSRSRMTVDPRIPTMPAQGKSGSHRPGRHCLRQSAKRNVMC